MMMKRQMKKRIYLTSLLMLTGVNLLAQEVKMRDLFAAMPDSLLPLVTRNNRLDCIDFIENHLEARVKNKLDQYVELKKLTEDYLLFQTSQKGYLEMKYVPNTDSTGVLYLVRTCLGPIADSSVKCFSQDWTPLECTLFRPGVEAFFSLPADNGKDDALSYALRELQDMPFLKATLSETAPRITWEISLQFLSKEDRERLTPYVKTVEYDLP